MLRCGANCLECTPKMQKNRGYSCRFKELYYSPEEIKRLRLQSFYAKKETNKEKTNP